MDGHFFHRIQTDSDLLSEYVPLKQGLRPLTLGLGDISSHAISGVFAGRNKPLPKELHGTSHVSNANSSS